MRFRRTSSTNDINIIPLSLLLVLFSVFVLGVSYVVFGCCCWLLLAIGGVSKFPRPWYSPKFTGCTILWSVQANTSYTHTQTHWHFWFSANKAKSDCPQHSRSFNCIWCAIHGFAFCHLTIYLPFIFNGNAASTVTSISRFKLVLQTTDKPPHMDGSLRRVTPIDGLCIQYEHLLISLC